MPIKLYLKKYLRLYRLGLTCLLCLIVYSHTLRAQQTVTKKEGFSYIIENGKVSSSVTYEYSFKNGTLRGDTLDFGGKTFGVLSLKIKNVDFNRAKYNGKRRIPPVKLLIKDSFLEKVGDSRWQARRFSSNSIHHDGNPINFEFEIRENGLANFSLRFAIIETAKNGNEEIKYDDNYIIKNIPAVYVIGIKSLEQQLWEQVSKDFRGMIIYLHNYPAGNKNYRQQAEKIIKNHINGAWEKISNTKKIEVLDDFIQQYDGYNEFSYIRTVVDRAKKARIGLIEAARVKDDGEDDDEEETEKIAFDKAIASRDSLEVKNFLEEYGENSRFALAAKDSILSWSPHDYNIIDRDGAWYRIKLINFKSPRYGEIYDELEVDDTYLASQHLILVRPLVHEEVQLRIIDSVFSHKNLSISLDNPILAKLEWDSTQQILTFSFEGGQRPYRLEIIDNEDGKVWWQRNGIDTNLLEVELAELEAKKIVGNLITKVYSEGAYQGLRVNNGQFKLEAKPSKGGYIVPAIIVSILAIGGLIWILIKRPSKPKRTIFDKS